MRIMLAALAVALTVWAVVAMRALSDPPIVGPDLLFVPPVESNPAGHPSADLKIGRLKAQLERERRTSRRLRRLLARRWTPTVHYAVKLASAATGVPAWELYRVAQCESGLSPFASNHGKYLGLFQLSWAPFGLDPFDPVANALSAAMTVRRDGGWRQWECKP